MTSADAGPSGPLDPSLSHVVFTLKIQTSAQQGSLFRAGMVSLTLRKACQLSAVEVTASEHDSAGVPMSRAVFGC